MEKFLFVIREDLKRLSQQTTEQERADRLKMDEWTKRIMADGQFIDANALKIEGRYVSKNSVLSDGPFIKSKEGISGYYVIQSASLNKAVELAQSCPLLIEGLAVIEVRPLDWVPEN